MAIWDRRLNSPFPILPLFSYLFDIAYSTFSGAMSLMFSKTFSYGFGDFLGYLQTIEGA